MNERIAFFGLGAIGCGMASNLLQAGYAVNVTLHRKRKNIDELQESGATVCASSYSAVESSDLVIMCLPSSREVSLVIDEVWSALNSRHLVLDTGTSSVSETLKLSKRLESRNVMFAEAPVAGGTVQAQMGILGAFVGASDEAFQRVRPVLEQFCKSVEHYGPVGRGGKAKLISNYLVLSMVRLIIETFHAASELNIDWNQFYQTISMGSSNSGALQRMIGSIVEDDNFAGYVFSVKNARKDLRYIAELSSSEGLQHILTEDALHLFEVADENGYGDLQVSELLRDPIRQFIDSQLRLSH